MINRGCGYNGRLGHGYDHHSQLRPKKVDALADEVIVDVACGWRQTCAVTSTGSVFTWGDGITTGHGEGRGTIVLNPS